MSTVLPIDIGEEMKRSYIDYAMSVIVSRALPDVRDGLKPVHRRILYAMHELGNTPDKPFMKSARTVGEVLGKYHPHGDVAVYDAMVRLAQEFSTRYLLVDGHGNFGSIDGDPPAAMRYTEARLSKLAMELLRDLDKETVDFAPNYDDKEQEPVILPARFPNLLVNGSSGIAVGMATNIPPHNLREVVDALFLLIADREVSDQELFRVVKGPDFPTRGIILGREGIRAAYTTGRGQITIRGAAKVEPLEGGREGRFRIVITELPYQVNKAKLIERIAELVREKKIEGLTDLRDESDRTGVRVVAELKVGVNPRVILNRLFKYTPLQGNFGINILALVGGRPQVLGLRAMLIHYLEHQKEVVVRRTQYDLRVARERAHILEGLRIALNNLDRVIALIRRSATVEEARTGLMEQFGLSQVQAQAILDLRLHRLTGLERGKIEEEYQQVMHIIAELEAILADEGKIYAVIRDELKKIRETHGDERRTRITDAGLDDLEAEDLIQEETVVVLLTNQGYIKRLPADTYRAQRRGGKGIIGGSNKAEDFPETFFTASTHQRILCFSDQGKVYTLMVHEIPEASRQARGAALINLLSLGSGEKITAVIPAGGIGEGNGGEGYLFFATRRGVVKKTLAAEYTAVRASGLIAIGLDADDRLIGVKLTDGEREVVLATKEGMAIRFAEGNVRPMGRAARGVTGIRLSPGDEVVGIVVSRGKNAGMDLLDGESGSGGEAVALEPSLLVVTEKGYGKRTLPEDFRQIIRGGKGVKVATLDGKSGKVAGIRLVVDEEIILISAHGKVIRVPSVSIPVLGRNARGVTLMRMGPEDKVAALALAEGIGVSPNKE